MGHTDTVLTVAMKGNIDAWLFIEGVEVALRLRMMIYNDGDHGHEVGICL